MASKRRVARSEKSSRSLSLPHAAEAPSLDLDLLRAVIELLEASDVTHLSWRHGRERLAIRRGSFPTPSVSLGPPSVGVRPTPAQAPAPTPVAVPATAPDTSPSASQTHLVTSPFVGTFYRTPAPDQPPFVEVGTVVRKGQVLCIIEAMKLMNEIEAEIAGKVVEIFAENGQPVEFGQPLFRLEPA